MASQPTQLSDVANRRAHLKEVTNEPPADSLGSELRAARLKLGADIKDASRFTKIKTDYLEALEEGRLDVLPGRTYAIGFIRSYASFLKLDPAATVARLKAEYPAAAAVEAAPIVGLPEVQNEMRIPQGALIIVGIIVIGLIYAGVYLFRAANEYMEQRARPGAAPMQTLSAAPDAVSSVSPQAIAPIGSSVAPSTESSVTPAATAPAISSAPATTAPAAEPHAATPPVTASVAARTPTPVKLTTPAPKPASPVGQTSAHTGSTTASNGDTEDTAAEPPSPAPTVGGSGPASPAVSTSEAASNASPAPADAETYERAVASAPKSFGAAAKDSRVMLRATDTVFLRIETDGPRNQVLFEGTLNKGEVYHVPTTAGVILTTRNGGAVDLFVDGASKGAAGPSGIALKGLPLDPDGLKAH